MRGYLIAKMLLTGERITMPGEDKSVTLDEKILKRLDMRAINPRGSFTDWNQVQAVLWLKTTVDERIAAWVNEAYEAVESE
jgi:hypothetical protein